MQNSRVFLVSNVLKRAIHSSSSYLKKMPDNMKGRSKSSQHWLTRHLNDMYVKQSRVDHYRARSAYKLIEIDDKYKILEPGQLVVDIGAAPGSWTQVAVERTNADKKASSKLSGTVCAIDLVQFEPIDGAICLPRKDFTDAHSLMTVLRTLHENVNTIFSDVVLCDMAPKATGISDLDQEKMSSLIESCFEFTFLSLKKKGTLLFKMWSGYKEKEIERNACCLFKSVKKVKPDACRTDSKEYYFLCRDFLREGSNMDDYKINIPENFPKKLISKFV